MDRNRNRSVETMFTIALVFFIFYQVNAIVTKSEEREKEPVATSQQAEITETERSSYTDFVAEHVMEKQMDIIRTMDRESETETEAEELQEEIYYDSLEELAILVEAEAGNQSLEGKRYVAAVVFNRVDHPEFPNTIKEVIEQPPGQFSTYWNGALDRTTPSEESYEAVRLELQERINTEVLFFTAGGYGAYGKPWKKIGDHYFCTWE